MFCFVCVRAKLTAYYGEDGILLEGLWAIHPLNNNVYPLNNPPFGTIFCFKDAPRRGASSYQLSGPPYWELRANISKHFFEILKK